MSKEKLFEAVNTNNIFEVRRLLHTWDWKAEPLDGLRNVNGHSLLTVAAQKGHADMVWLLAGDFGVKLDVRDGLGMTPLHHAAMFGHEAALNELVKLGAPLSVKNQHGFTALHMAAVHDRAKASRAGTDAIPATVKALVAAGASVPTEPKDWPPSLQSGGTRQLQEIVDRGAAQADEAAVPAKRWQEVVANARLTPQAPAAGPGLSM